MQIGDRVLTRRGVGMLRAINLGHSIVDLIDGAGQVTTGGTGVNIPAATARRAVWYPAAGAPRCWPV
jgi:hypothetical protein